MTTITPLALADVLHITPKRHGDARGWFAETWSRKAYTAAGIASDFVQDNQAYNATKGTLRGLHFQRSPHAQAKLGVRRLLEVQAAHGAGLGVERLVVLHERDVEPGLGERRLAPGFREPSTCIAMALRRDKQDLGEGQRRDRRHGNSKVLRSGLPDGA